MVAAGLFCSVGLCVSLDDQGRAFRTNPPAAIYFFRFSLVWIFATSALGSSVRKLPRDIISHTIVLWCYVWGWNLHFSLSLKKKLWLTKFKTNHIFPWTKSCDWRRGPVCKHGKEVHGRPSLGFYYPVRACTHRFGTLSLDLKCHKERIQARSGNQCQWLRRKSSPDPYDQVLFFGKCDFCLRCGRVAC